MPIGPQEPWMGKGPNLILESLPQIIHPWNGDSLSRYGYYQHLLLDNVSVFKFSEQGGLSILNCVL